MEFSQSDFEALLRRFFRVDELYGQQRTQTRRHRLLQRADLLGLRKRLPLMRRVSRVVAGTSAIEDVTADETAISSEGIEHASELIAVCRR